MTTHQTFNRTDGSTILRSSDGSAAEVMNRHGASDIVLICEHASNRIPEELDSLGLADAELQSHVAWDPGAADLARHMSVTLDATLILGRFSRLVYDCNRPPNSDSAMPAHTEASTVPGNASINAAARLARTHEIYVPFHAAVVQVVAEKRAGDTSPIIVTIHSFTPVFHGTRRSVDLGLLHGTDARLATALHMPAVLQFNRSVIAPRFDTAAAYLGIEGGFDGFCAYVDDFNDAMKIPRTLTNLGVEDPDLDALTAAALRDPSTGGNPVEMTPENTRKLFQDLL